MQVGDYDDAPGVLVISSSSLGGGAAAVARAGGARIMAVVPLDASVEQWSEHLGAAALLVECDSAQEERMAKFLRELAGQERPRSRNVVIGVPMPLIDLAFSYFGATDAVLLCDPKRGDWAEAIALATAKRPNRVADIGAEARRLIDIGREVERIAASLTAIGSQADLTDAVPDPRRGAVAIDAQAIRSVIRMRRLRDEYFAANLFGDPAWDMLLDLMAARLESKPVAVSSLCIAAAVPATTALRWIKRMTDEGLLVRRSDPEDGRRVFIELSDAAADAMMRYIETAHRQGHHRG